MCCDTESRIKDVTDFGASKAERYLLHLTVYVNQNFRSITQFAIKHVCCHCDFAVKLLLQQLVHS